MSKAADLIKQVHQSDKTLSLEKILPLFKGDVPGHEFRGNQYVGDGGGGDKPDLKNTSTHSSASRQEVKARIFASATPKANLSDHADDKSASADKSGSSKEHFQAHDAHQAAFNHAVRSGDSKAAGHHAKERDRHMKAGNKAAKQPKGK